MKEIIMFCYKNDAEFFMKLVLIIILAIAIIVTIFHITGLHDVIRTAIHTNYTIRCIKRIANATINCREITTLDPEDRIINLGAKHDANGSVIVNDPYSEGDEVVAVVIDRYKTFSGENLLRNYLKPGVKEIDLKNGMFAVNIHDIADLTEEEQNKIHKQAVEDMINEMSTTVFGWQHNDKEDK